jgi:hypothetical protein
MNKEDVWQVIKAILKVLVAVGIFLFLFMDSKGHINGDQAETFIFGFVAGWAVTFGHFKKKGTKNESREK